jgi:hypothetical protein
MIIREKKTKGDGVDEINGHLEARMIVYMPHESGEA